MITIVRRMRKFEEDLTSTVDSILQILNSTTSANSSCSGKWGKTTTTNVTASVGDTSLFCQVKTIFLSVNLLLLLEQDVSKTYTICIYFMKFSPKYSMQCWNESINFSWRSWVYRSEVHSLSHFTVFVRLFSGAKQSNKPKSCKVVFLSEKVQS